MKKTPPKKRVTPSVRAAPSSRRATPAGKRAGPEGAKRTVKEQVAWVLEWLKGHATRQTLDGMARYAIPSDRAFGVAMKDMKALGKTLGKDHELALALWETGWYEARMLTSFVADPSRMTAARMDQWCKEFDSWALCDTLCFHLFDRTAHAWMKVEQWSRGRGEFERRTAFALLWSLALHDRRASDRQFLDGLGFIEDAAADERNFVKKAVDMALRAVGRRNPALHTAAVAVARRLAAAPSAAARWVGSHALRELTSP